MTRFETRIDDMAANKPGAASNNDFHDGLKSKCLVASNASVSLGNPCYLRKGSSTLPGANLPSKRVKEHAFLRSLVAAQ